MLVVVNRTHAMKLIRVRVGHIVGSPNVDTDRLGLTDEVRDFRVGSLRRCLNRELAPDDAFDILKKQLTAPMAVEIDIAAHFFYCWIKMGKSFPEHGPAMVRLAALDQPTDFSCDPATARPRGAADFFGRGDVSDDVERLQTVGVQLIN